MKNIMFILLVIAVPELLHAQKETTDTSGKKWEFSLSGFYYFLPEEDNIFLPIFTADYKSLHLESRYNYEDLNTASAFAGWRFETGQHLQFAATPMLGFAFGNTDAFVPAIELELSYKRFDFYSETEYLVDFAGKEYNFAYTYTELAASFFKERLRTGFTGQRTRLYQEAKDYAPGIFAQYNFFDRLNAGIYYYNPFSGSNYAVVSLSVDF